MVEPARPRGGRRLADAAVARDVCRLRPEHRLRPGGRRASSTSPTSTPRPLGCALNDWALAGHLDGRAARRGARTSPAGGSPSGSTRATSTSSWDPPPRERRSRSGSSSTASRGRRRTGPTWPPTAAGSVARPAHVPADPPARARSPTAASRSSSSTPASRRTASRSADRRRTATGPFCCRTDRFPTTGERNDRQPPLRTTAGPCFAQSLDLTLTRTLIGEPSRRAGAPAAIPIFWR